MNRGLDVGRRTRAVVFGAGKEVVDHLRAVGASGDAGVFGKPGGAGGNVVHAPMGERGGGVEQHHDKALGALRDVGPGEFGRLVAAGAAVERANVDAIHDNV